MALSVWASFLLDYLRRSVRNVVGFDGASPCGIEEQGWVEAKDSGLQNIRGES
jgi:hypothetical protein